MHAVVIPLQAADRPLIEAHLLRLSAEDRSLRFAAGAVPDDVVRRYVDSIDFDRQAALGCVSLRGEVFAFAHGCPFVHGTRRHLEVAFSVDEAWRGHGLARRLMDAMLARATASGGAIVIGRCAARNLPMRRVFEHGGLTLQRAEDEFEARREVCCAA